MTRATVHMFCQASNLYCYGYKHKGMMMYEYKSTTKYIQVYKAYVHVVTALDIYYAILHLMEILFLYFIPEENITRGF